MPHNYVIPQAMPHAIPQTHSAFYPHRVTRHYVSRTKNKYAKANRIYICPEHFTDNIERKYFRFALKRRLYNKR